MKGDDQYRKLADLITVTAGGNDLIQAALPFVYEGDAGILRSALQAYETNYRSMLEAIRGAKAGHSSSALIVLVGLYNPLPLMAEAAEWVRRFNEFLFRLAGTGVRVVDVYDVFLGRERELLYSDHIHPNARGYAAIAEQIVRSVPPIIVKSRICCSPPAGVDSGQQFSYDRENWYFM